MKKLILFLFILILASSVYAAENKMTLLAVKETPEGFVGGTAELILEIEDGKGRVFLETSPLTKVDTQVSTRFAKQIACDFLEVDCSNLDFIYTIKSDAPIVGGPSAGASMAILTVATLKDIPLNKDLAITGTINSGGVIGPVGGIDAKARAAEKIGLKKVLIPIGEQINSSNSTNLTIEVMAVGTLNEALFEFTGKKLKKERTGNVVIDPEYTKIMKSVSTELCQRSEGLLNSMENQTVENIRTIINESKQLLTKQDYYSAASKCFSANIQLNKIANQGLSEDLLSSKLKNLRKDAEAFDEEISERTLKTIPELQTYMIVKERVNEALEYYEKSVKELTDSEIEGAINDYSYAEERLNSAKSWSNFFNKTGKELDLTEEVLKKACSTKILEANERIQYVSLVYGLEISSIQERLEKAKQQQGTKEYALCLNTASLSKAEVDSIISSAGATDDDILREIIQVKLDIAKENILEEQERGNFPIAGYSYFEYSQNLINNSVHSALLFSQYAQELSSFDLYFQETSKIDVKTDKREFGDYELIILYAIGIITGVIITYMVLARQLR
ncbi:hypothetical protein HN592_00975 [Candidatus Woesearchaeota archaeon]|jgi:uncharacterized protein|nr:hypothetical protein [Candidatus Woesearchaeota archaeon]MBT4368877.1 hypothetical protein [Candidatus Woesearchaeota archaeon]MBT4712166.1 hypothetical protein [Candidatus Woesearchaeota archaeon]MBT6639086.1 hypothetical protein [Candidatus Woesearchaeota archaeon]MBT7134286.1 hypothetical protein [Candidatus Woesearchaeota archaeon]